MGTKVYLAGTGAYLPGNPVEFDDIERYLGALTEAPGRIQAWIKRTTPVMKELLAVDRVHYAIDPITREFTEDNITMSCKAARAAMASAGIQSGDIDLICYGSPHQDQMPTASVRIQEQLGIDTCQELSIHANCTSAYKALHIASQLIAAGTNRTALVVSSNISSSELRAEYYNQSRVDKESLFLRWFLSDGAGAVVLSADAGKANTGLSVEHTYIESIGGSRPSLMFNDRPALWLNPREEFDKALHHLRQRFRNALSTSLFQESDGSVFLKGLRRMLSEAGVAPESIAVFQVNLPARHIAESVMDECVSLGIPPSAYYTDMDSLGYCGPPMAFICLDSIVRNGQVKPGRRLASFVTEVSKFMQAGYIMRYDG